jgi:hypothetical protein
MTMALHDPLGDRWILAIAWSLALTVAGWAWARAAFAKQRHI